MARPNSARLLASVAPDVKMISSASAPISAPTAAADSCTARAAYGVRVSAHPAPSGATLLLDGAYVAPIYARVRISVDA